MDVMDSMGAWNKLDAMLANSTSAILRSVPTANEFFVQNFQQLRLVVCGRVRDFTNGSVGIKTLKLVLDYESYLFLSSDFHMKVYYIGEEILLNSSSLMKFALLLIKVDNIELSVLGALSHFVLRIANKVGPYLLERSAATQKDNNTALKLEALNSFPSKILWNDGSNIKRWITRLSLDELQGCIFSEPSEGQTSGRKIAREQHRVCHDNAKR